MKFVLKAFCLFAIISLVFTEPLKEEEKIAAETCQKQTNANDDDMKILEDFEATPETRTQYCLLACFYKTTGALDGDNRLVYEKALLELEPLKKEDQKVYNIFAKFMKECSSDVVPEKDECDAIKQYMDCITKKAKAFEAGGGKI